MGSSIVYLKDNPDKYAEYPLGTATNAIFPSNELPLEIRCTREELPDDIKNSANKFGGNIYFRLSMEVAGPDLKYTSKTFEIPW
jgi:hypothetical protein